MHADKESRHAVSLATPSFASAEIAAGIGYRAVLIDIEHGTFDLSDLERFIPFAKSQGLEVLAKVLSPERASIQQALDFGADAVVIPHVQSFEHASEVTSYSKFPPLGDRSIAGGRTCSYNWVGPEWSDQQNVETRCYPMIETAGALEDIDKILSLPTVDGVFVGQSDLALRRGRGAYTGSPEDLADLRKIAEAARVAGKPWILPAYGAADKKFGIEHGAAQLVLTMEHFALISGLTAAFTEAEDLLSPQYRD